MRRGAFEEVDACSYELSEAEYAGSEADYSWVDRMLNTLAATFQWLQPLLTPGNYDALVPSLLEKVLSLSLELWLRVGPCAGFGRLACGCIHVYIQCVGLGSLTAKIFQPLNTT